MGRLAQFAIENSRFLILTIFAVMARVNKFIAEQLPEAQGRTEELFLGPSPLGTVELRLIGIFSLAGIIINNGIVMIDRIDQERASGKGVDDAIVSAAVARARPIIMTTLTTILGLVPLALYGGEFWYGMAIVIMGGLAVGTVLTLAVVPALYSLLFNFSRPRKPSASTPEPTRIAEPS